MTNERRHVNATFVHLFSDAEAIDGVERTLTESGWRRVDGVQGVTWIRELAPAATFPEVVNLAHDEIDEARARATAGVRVQCRFIVEGVRVASFKILSL